MPTLTEGVEEVGCNGDDTHKHVPQLFAHLGGEEASSWLPLAWQQDGEALYRNRTIECTCIPDLVLGKQSPLGLLPLATSGREVHVGTSSNTHAHTH